MTTVFLSGSRKIWKLNEQVLDRLQNILDQSLDVLVGDANGVDKAFQKYLSVQGYDRVTVFYAGEEPRNNLGDWATRRVENVKKLRGRALHTQKDRLMADIADFGFVVWDGRSVGSLANIAEMIKRGKRSLVFLNPLRSFSGISSAQELRSLLTHCDHPSGSDHGLLRDLDTAQPPHRFVQADFGF